MNLIAGILLFALGVIALFAWFVELVPFFKGLLVCSLLGWGAVAVVIGVAKMRARAHLAKAKMDEKSEAEVRASE